MTPRNDDPAVNEFALSIGLLLRKMRSETPSESHEFSWTQKSVLARLYKEGPATTAELARAEGVKPQSMGTAIATLEEMGMVERKPHATDGRQVNIQLSEKGASILKAGKDARRTWLAQVIAKLDKRERALLFEAGEIIKRLAENE